MNGLLFYYVYAGKFQHFLFKKIGCYVSIQPISETGQYIFVVKFE